MNKIAGGIAAIAALIGAPAFAADMAVKAPPPAPAPVYSWTGWYVGGNLGYIGGVPITITSSLALAAPCLPQFRDHRM
jgi:hypothetical protein